MEAEKRIFIDREQLHERIKAMGIRSLRSLAVHLKPMVPRVSDKSINRWNRYGWPEHKYRVLCRLLAVDDSDLMAR